MIGIDGLAPSNQYSLYLIKPLNQTLIKLEIDFVGDLLELKGRLS